MTRDRKTVYVNDKPIEIFIWAEVQHCVNAYDSELYLAVQRGEAEIVDPNGDRIGWGGFASDGDRPAQLIRNEPEEKICSNLSFKTALL